MLTIVSAKSDGVLFQKKILCKSKSTRQEQPTVAKGLLSLQGGRKEGAEVLGAV